VTDRYLDALLLSALTAPGAATSSSAGRIIGQLLGVAATAGDGDAIAPYLTAMPGQPSTFEVHRYRPGETQPTIVAANLNAADAVRLAMLPLPEDAAGVEVISRDGSGLLRCAVVKAAKGQLEYLFPAADSFDGNQDHVARAHRLWLDTLASWSAHAQVAANGRSDNGAGLTADDLHSAADLHSAGLSLDNLGRSGDSPGRSGEIPAGTALVPVPTQSVATSRDNGPAGQVGSGSAQDVLEAVRSSLANMTVEVDLQEVEDLIRRTVAEGPPIATPRDVARVLAKVVPTANDIADQVAVKVVEKLADKLADQMAATVSSALRNSISGTQLAVASPAGAAVATSSHDRRLVSALLEAMERLATEMHDVRDQVRKSRTQLDTFEGRLSRFGQSDRALETLRDALTGDLDRLGQRLEQQIKEAADSGEPVPDGEQIANLSRRLRRSSIYLDRVLGRLDQLISHQAVGGPPGNGTTTRYTPSDADADTDTLLDDDEDLGPTRFAVRTTPAEPKR
jgi:hypothetical protein